MAKRLVKSTDKKLFGVAGGLAEYFNIDPTIVRVGFVVASPKNVPFFVVPYSNSRSGQSGPPSGLVPTGGGAPTQGGGGLSLVGQPGLIPRLDWLTS